MGTLFQRYLLPGLVFQGLVIGGGYATGRELVAFFFPAGPVGGLLGMAVAAGVWSAVMAVSFELCRMQRSYDYRHFFRSLLGRGWILYEALLVVLMILVLGVIAAACGEIVANVFGLPPAFGTALLLVVIGTLVFRGSGVIERFMGAWSLLLYACYIVLVAWTLSRFGPDVARTFESQPNPGGTIRSGLAYAGYNLAAAPMVFFVLKHQERRREAVISGLLAGPIGMVPAVLLFVSLMALPDAMRDAPIPSAVLLSALDAGLFEAVFQLVLLGTLVQTGVGLVHGVNERIAASLAERGRAFPPAFRPLTAALLLLIALGLAAAFGIVGLIARGYGLLTFGFIAVFVLPVLTVGLWRVLRWREPAQ